MTNATLRKVTSWHSRSKISKITEKTGLKFWKLTFFMGKNNQAIYNFSYTQAKK